MIASRWAVPTAALLAIALVPTLIHSYAGYVVDDGRRAEQVGSSLAGMASSPTDRTDEWMQRRFESADWAERTYGPDLRLSVVRSYDPKRVYHHPELALSYREMTLGASEQGTVPGRADVPVMAVRAADGKPGLALYALQYGDQFVGDPIGFQVRLAFSLLFRGREPMTLFYVQDKAAPAGVPLADSRAMTLLAAAVDDWNSHARQ